MEHDKSISGTQRFVTFKVRCKHKGRNSIHGSCKCMTYLLPPASLNHPLDSCHAFECRTGAFFHLAKPLIRIPGAGSGLYVYKYDSGIKLWPKPAAAAQVSMVKFPLSSPMFSLPASYITLIHYSCLRVTVHDIKPCPHYVPLETQCAAPSLVHPSKGHD